MKRYYANKIHIGKGYAFKLRGKRGKVLETYSYGLMLEIEGYDKSLFMTQERFKKLLIKNEIIM